MHLLKTLIHLKFPVFWVGQPDERRNKPWINVMRKSFLPDGVLSTARKLGSIVIDPRRQKDEHFLFYTLYSSKMKSSKNRLDKVYSTNIS